MTEIQQTEIEIALGEVLARAVSALDGAGVPTPRPDAEAILASVTGVGRPDSATALPPGLTSSEHDEFSARLKRRLEGEPLAYVLGTSDFRYITLDVDPRVLIPRPETEMLVELAVELGPGRLLE